MSTPFVSQPQLDQMRAQWRASASDLAVVSWPVVQGDGQGGDEDTGEVETSDAMPASRGPLNRGISAQLTVQDRVLPEGSSVIYLPYDFDVPAAGEIVLNSADRYEIVVPVPRRTNQVRRSVVVRLLGPVDGES